MTGAQMKGQKKLEAYRKFHIQPILASKMIIFTVLYTVSRWQFFEIRSKWTTFSGPKMLITRTQIKAQKKLEALRKFFILPILA